MVGDLRFINASLAVEHYHIFYVGNKSDWLWMCLYILQWVLGVWQGYVYVLFTVDNVWKTLLHCLQFIVVVNNELCILWYIGWWPCYHLGKILCTQYSSVSTMSNLLFRTTSEYWVSYHLGVVHLLFACSKFLYAHKQDWIVNTSNPGLAF